MCGRFTLNTPRVQVLQHYGLTDAPTLLSPRYNISPTQNIAVVRAGPQGRELRELRWGLVPHWSKGIDPKLSMFNARAESVDTKPAFRSLIKRRRCLVPADGFFEWQPMGGYKQPWLFVMRGGVFSMAGLWDRWECPGHQPIESVTIITTEANDLVRPCHDRMPVILGPADYDFWLDPGIQEPEALRPLLVPHPVAGMDAYPVTPKVGRASYQASDAVQPIKPTQTDPDL
jgi:putative SOS response-associated peptidase YedK